MPDQQQFVQTASLTSDTARKLQSTKQKESLIVSRFFLLWAKDSWWVSPWTTCRWLIVILGCFPHVTQKTRWIDLRIQCSVSPGRIQVWFIGRAVVECCRGNRQEGECSAAPAKDRLLQKWVTLSLSSRIHSHLAQHIRKYAARVIALCRFTLAFSSRSKTTADPFHTFSTAFTSIRFKGNRAAKSKRRRVAYKVA